MRIRWIAAAGIILTLGSTMASMAAEERVPEESESQETAVLDWQWQEEPDGWRYVNAAGKFKKTCWEEIKGYWYYFNHDGYMASDWTRISGLNYCFSETGEQVLGWCYNDEEEKWHYYKEDGTAQKGWYQEANGSWYWFSIKGEMAASGYKNVSGKRYYFFDNGQMAANQYVGLFYMDENGQRNKEFDITVNGKRTSTSMSSEIKNAFTESTKNIPRDWIRKFVDQGWEIIYYPGKKYFSAPMTDSGIYYVCHKLDTHYKKIKICQPEDLTAAFGEYIGYASGSFKSSSQDATDLLMSRGLVEDFVNIPDYFYDDTMFYFGKLVAAYVSNSSSRKEMEEEAPQVTEILKRILYTGKEY